MGLVDYSASESESSEPETKAPTPAVARPSKGDAKKPFQKVVDRSNPGKILVKLPEIDQSAVPEPPAKRARTTGGGGRFSGFNSFLPPPKNANAPRTTSTAAGPKPGVNLVNLKTSAEPGFSRDPVDDYSGPTTVPSADVGRQDETSSQTANEDGQGKEPDKGAAPVLVGKPLMFKPLSVSRNPGKTKKVVKNNAAATAATSGNGPNATQLPATTTSSSSSSTPATQAPPPPKRSLFSIQVEDTRQPTAHLSTSSSGSYEPYFQAAATASTPGTDLADAKPESTSTIPPTVPQRETLDDVAKDLKLSAAERRELFGRGNSGMTAGRLVNFSMDQEYRHNEAIRAAGEQQTHRPVRSIVGGGKHSLKQLVQNVSDQREALEESFAKGKTNRKEASSRYGW